MPWCSSKTTDVIQPQIAKIDYTITIKTGDRENSTTNGPVYINIFGRDNQSTGYILLTNSPNDKSFRQGSIETLQIKAIDIGKPRSIIIRHEDDINGWFLDYVEISVNKFLIRFVANRWLNTKKNDRQLSVELFGSEQSDSAAYTIEVQTGNEQIEPLDSPVYVQLYGATTKTPKLFLEPKTACFARDSCENFDISTNNIGEIRKIVIGHEGNGAVSDWHLKNVKIQTTDERLKFDVNKWLSRTKYDQKLSIELNRNERRPPSPTIVTYLVKIQTVDTEQTDRIDNIEMSIQGSTGQIDKFSLKDHMKSDLDQFQVEHADIGNIESITIGFNDDNKRQAAWLLESVDIETKETVYHFQAQCWLSNRLGSNSSWITIRPDKNNDYINYSVSIKTGKSNITSNVILCIYGDKKTTKLFPLRTIKNGTKVKFDKDDYFEFDLKDINVGRIEKINIGHDGQGNEQKWLLKSVRIEKNDEHYVFQADRTLSENEGNFIDLLPLEKKQVLYKITTVTNSADESATDSGVFMIIYGDNDRTKQFQLITTEQDPETFFQKGNTDNFEFNLDDVGEIRKINVRLDGKGFHPIWHLDTVRIQKGSEIYKFNADKVLGLSLQEIDLTPTPTEKPSAPPSIKRQSQENMVYKVSVRFGTLQQTANDDHDGNLYLIIVGKRGQTKKMPLPVNEKGEIEFKTNDVGKVSKIFLGQDDTRHQVVWHIDNLVIKRGAEITTFNVERSIEANTEIELKPSPIKKSSDIDYEIKTVTGDKTYEGGITFKIRGEFGITTISLSQTVSGEKPFQSKATDEFKYRKNDVGKIKRLIIEYNGTKTDNFWHLKTVQIIKADECYNFHANVRLDYSEQKIVLHPTDQRKEDFVQTELRRLKENLHCESLKMRRPPHKAHEPFVYNDLKPYFDTSNVENAIHEPLEHQAGYYTRVTALRIVEPWEAHGMDYGVNYELLKQRRLRGHSAKRLLPTRNGMMLLPPPSLPFGGQITHINPTKVDRSRSSVSSKSRPTARYSNQQSQTTTMVYLCYCLTIKTDESIDRTQGSTHLPEFPCVTMEKPSEYHRPLTLNDVSNIRSYIRSHSALRANCQKEKDYKRTQDDFYRMQLDSVAGHHPRTRDNMVRVYRSYLGTTPGSRKAVRDLCDQLPLNATKTTVESTV
ncbi:unnamed protein product [Rotaria magnacalcarata]|uniref:PLAT domain-containing protein n=1 Tax=Rotaria magnacalcarata TaxID=392030 RepID=A0A819EVQ1_9BILA|nr:unnamed protein product [Rotaria magnacalcarata]